MNLRVQVKRFLARHMLVQEFCKECGRDIDIVWSVPDYFWEQVAGDATVLCPRCFANRLASLPDFYYWTVIRESEYSVAAAKLAVNKEGQS